MADRRAGQLGGICGILFAALTLPSFVVGRPEVLDETSSPQEVIDYFSAWQDQLLIGNGVVLIFAAFFFLWFLGILHGMLRRAEGEWYGLSSVALAGGLMLITLKLAGVAAEIYYPSTLVRFENFQQDAQLGFLALEFSGWLYHFAYIGASVLITATSVVALRTNILPKWLAWVSFVVALVLLLHFLVPIGSLLALLWVAAVSVLMLAGFVNPSTLTTRS
ncbi:MAG: hypothetical protein M3315_14185 [Actinomycetota bacterium]|nr:hypothetical protein [Actinomycetota bacterium]